MCRSFTADEELPGSLANTATRWERVGIGGNADRSVHAAEEESEVRAAFNLDQWPKLMNLQASLPIFFLPLSTIIIKIFETPASTPVSDSLTNMYIQELSDRWRKIHILSRGLHISRIGLVLNVHCAIINVQ